MSEEFRSGVGYDLHRLEADRKLILGGIEIPFDKGLAGHSDADILMHAVTDALLGAAGLGDIGELFPPSDPQWKDAESKIFLLEAKQLVQSYGFEIVNLDAVIVIERPKILPFREKIRENLSKLLEVDRGRIGLKAKTSESVGPIGRGEAAECHVVAMLRRSVAARVM